jgi:hypothetical protein
MDEARTVQGCPVPPAVFRSKLIEIGIPDFRIENYSYFPITNRTSTYSKMHVQGLRNQQPGLPQLRKNTSARGRPNGTRTDVGIGLKQFGRGDTRTRAERFRSKT